MTKDYSRVFKLENEPSKFVETPVVRKKFRVTIDVEATLSSVRAYHRETRGIRNGTTLR